MAKRKKRRSKQRPKGGAPSTAQKRSSKKDDTVQANIEISYDFAPSYEPDVEAWITGGIKHLRRGRIEEAKAAFEMAIAREPRARDAYLNLAVAHATSGDMEAAEELFKQTVEKFPQYVLARANLAQIYTRRGEFEQAEAILPMPDKVRRMTPPEFRQYALAWADLLAHQFEYDGALAWLRMLADVEGGIFPRFLRRRIHYWLGRLLARGISQEEKEAYVEAQYAELANDKTETD